MKKSFILPLFFYSLIGFVHIGCTAEEIPKERNLTLGEVYTGTNFSLTFDAVISDSRCPKGVTCVWEGNAEVEFMFKNVMGIESNFSLDTHTGSNFTNDTLINNYRIKLLDVYPYPEKDKEIQFDDYVVAIEISKE